MPPEVFKALRRRQAIPAHHFSDAAVDALTTAPVAMPPGFYNSPELPASEQECLFYPGWICVGRVEQVPLPGDYFTAHILDEPLVVLRSDADTIKVLSNVCRHRGSVMLEGAGNTRKLMCPYHHWSYRLDGSLLRAPLVDETPGFEASSCRLPEFGIRLWYGWILVNLDQSADPEGPDLQGLDEYVAAYHPEEMQLVDSYTEEWPVNWKILAENFMEGYHLTPVHRHTLHPMTPTRLCEKISATPYYTGYKSHYDETFPGRSPYHPDMTSEQRRLSMMVWIYPSFVAAISPNSTVFMSITPTGAESLQTTWGVLARPELFDLIAADGSSSEARARLEFAASFNAEDKARLLSVQRGLKSRFSSGGPLAPPDYEGTIWDFYHYYASHMLEDSYDVDNSDQMPHA